MVGPGNQKDTAGVLLQHSQSGISTPDHKQKKESDQARYPLPGKGEVGTFDFCRPLLQTKENTAR